MANLDEYYQVLGIDHGATLEEVEEAYGELARVWGPERFPNDDHIRQMAEKKMIEIDAARDALLDLLRSKEKATPRGEIDGEGARLNGACDNPRCNGILDSNGTCYECGKVSGSNTRHTVFCPACGARNIIASQRDYDRGICSGCRRPLGVPVKLKRKSSRKTAYSILLVVIVALAWFFFSSEKPRTPGPKKIPLNTQASQPSTGIPAEKVVDAQVQPLTEPEAHQVESTPNSPNSLHPTGQSAPSGRSFESIREAPQGPSPSEDASSEKEIPLDEARGVLAEENRGPQPNEQAAPTSPEGEVSKPVEQVGAISTDARKDAKPVEVTPSPPGGSGKENFDRLLDEVAKKKATRARGRTGELRDLPFGKLNQ